MNDILVLLSWVIVVKLVLEKGHECANLLKKYFHSKWHIRRLV